MNSSKAVDICKSSLIGLKAELSRKQEEVQKNRTNRPLKTDEKAIAAVNNDDYAYKLFSKSKMHNGNFGNKKSQRRDNKEKTEPGGLSYVGEENVEVKEEEEVVRISRVVLEAKSKLYDHLQNDTFNTTDNKSEYLVDFKKKAYDDKNEMDNNKETGKKIVRYEDEEGNNVNRFQEKTENEGTTSPNERNIRGTINENCGSGNNSKKCASSAEDSDDEWVDFVDALGRSRRCLRVDLPTMKKKDKELAKTMQPSYPSASVHVFDGPDRGETSDIYRSQSELMSKDMHHEMLRRKWEEQEQKLLNKRDVHYQDLLFDEARVHGVGYYSFSTDEAERARQQQELLKLRQDTIKQQQQVKGIRAARNKQLKARLRAAKARNRQRLGLPPLQDNDSTDDDDDVKVTGYVDNGPESNNSESVSAAETCEKRTEELENLIKRTAYVRPWDAGKEGVNARHVMTQEEWVDQKREERISEFAPPKQFQSVDMVDQYQKTRNAMEAMESNAVSESLENTAPERPGLFFTTKKRVLQKELPLFHKYRKTSQSILDRYKEKETQQIASINIPRVIPEQDSKKGMEDHHLGNLGIEIPPPPVWEYYMNDGSSGRKRRAAPSLADGEVKDSIAHGLEYLKKQCDLKEQKREKGLLDII